MTERQRDLERYRRVLDEMPASVSIYRENKASASGLDPEAVHDADRRFVFVNDSLAAAYDSTPDELVGTESPTLKRLRTERDDDPFAELVVGDRERFADAVVLDLPDREEAIIDYELTRLETDGEFDGVLGVFRDVTVLADGSRLKQLLENLFRNSVEHGSTSSRTKSGDSVEQAGHDVTVRVGELEDGSGFFVEDDGPGIPEHQRDAVFDSGHSTATSGTGFGLAIVEGVAEAHGWTVTLTESDEGGARFEFTGVERAS